MQVEKTTNNAETAQQIVALVAQTIQQSMQEQQEEAMYQQAEIDGVDSQEIQQHRDKNQAPPMKPEELIQAIAQMISKNPLQVADNQTNPSSQMAGGGSNTEQAPMNAGGDNTQG